MFLTTLLLWLVYLTARCRCSATAIYINPIGGNDTSLCSSFATSRQPCRTLRYALGGVGCDCTHISESNATIFENTVVELADGVHVVEDCIGITFGKNITIKAKNAREAIIECGHFPSTERFETGLLSCNTVGLTFIGIVFQHCGPATPNVFLNRSSNVLFEDCTFRYVSVINKYCTDTMIDLESFSHETLVHFMSHSCCELAFIFQCSMLVIELQPLDQFILKETGFIWPLL